MISKPNKIQSKVFHLLFILFILLIPVLNGCAGMGVKRGPNAKVALVLGGGGARGFAHVGVIRELESAGIPIHMIVGVSVGSLIGALYADTADSFKLEWKSFKINKNEIFDFKVLNISEGLAKGRAILQYIDRNIEARLLEDLKIPLAVVAVDINTGSRVVFQTGPIRDAVRASVSVPGVFPPFPFEDKLLVDGGVMGNLAPQVAKDLGADIVIGVNIAKSRNGFLDQNPNALTVILESIDIMGAELVQLKKDRIDFLITPDVGDVGITDFSRKKEMIEAGRIAAKKIIGQIKEAIR